MSSEAEMTMLVREIADHSASTSNWKERVQAAARALGLPFGRIKAHYYGEARRVDAEEMDRARAAARDLREHHARQQATDLIGNVNRTLAYLRAVDPDGYRHSIDSLEHALGRAGLLDRALVEADADKGEAMPAAHPAEI